jgi:hypothetical protein
MMAEFYVHSGPRSGDTFFEDQHHRVSKQIFLFDLHFAGFARIDSVGPSVMNHTH